MESARGKGAASSPVEGQTGPFDRSVPIFTAQRDQASGISNAVLELASGKWPCARQFIDKNDCQERVTRVHLMILSTTSCFSNVEYAACGLASGNGGLEMRLLTYLISVCLLALTIGAANASTFDWSFTSDQPSVYPDFGGNGTLTASDDGGGQYTVTAISGTVSLGSCVFCGPFQIIGLLPTGPTSEYASLPVPGDNLIFFPTSPLVDNSGISFATYLAAYQVPSFMNIGYSDHYYLYESNGGSPGISFSLSPGSPNISAAPVPSSWILMLTGFAGLGYMAYRRRSNALLAT